MLPKVGDKILLREPVEEKTLYEIIAIPEQLEYNIGGVYIRTKIETSGSNGARAIPPIRHPYYFVLPEEFILIAETDIIDD